MNPPRGSRTQPPQQPPPPPPPVSAPPQGPPGQQQRRRPPAVRPPSQSRTHAITETLRTGPQRLMRRKVTYHVPDAAEAGWSAAPSKRRAWTSRAALLGILFVQIGLTLRLHNTAFQDEALYLFAGHAEIDHYLHGADVGIYNFEGFFSGAPQIYPVMGAMADNVAGLTGARLLSLLFMLGSTALMYSFTRRLFSERAALCGAALFVTAQSTQFMGFFATYDALSVFLIAMAVWIAVRTGKDNVWWGLLVAPVLAFAFGVKYASALYFPPIAAIAFLVTWRHHSIKLAIARSVAMLALSGVLAYAMLKALGLETALAQTTTNRAPGTDSIMALGRMVTEWGGLIFLVGLFGGIVYIRKGRLGEVNTKGYDDVPSRLWRSLLVAVLLGTSLLAPLYQMKLATGVSLHKHIGYGLLFTAAIAGVGVVRVIGRHFSYPQLGIMMGVVIMIMGMAQASWNFGVWPDSSRMIATIKPYMNHKDHYLADVHEVPAYYMRELATPSQWTGTYFIDYGPKHLQGAEGYTAAINDGYFSVVVLDGGSQTAFKPPIQAALTAPTSRYRLRAKIKYETVNGPNAYDIYVKR